MAAFAFLADGEAAVAEQPGQGSLDLPPVAAEPLGGLPRARSILATAVGMPVPQGTERTVRRRRLQARMVRPTGGRLQVQAPGRQKYGRLTYASRCSGIPYVCYVSALYKTWDSHLWW